MKQITRTAYRGREFRFKLAVEGATTSDFTIEGNASDGTTTWAATVTEDAANDCWYITWSDTQTTAMTADKVQFEVKITDTQGNDYQGYEGMLILKDTIG